MNEFLLATAGPQGPTVAGLTGLWTEIKPANALPSFGDGGNWAQVGRYVYILTGTTTTTAPTFYRFDLETFNCISLAPPSRPGYMAELIWDGNDTIYAWQGYGKTTQGNYCWQYSIANNTWTVTTTTPTDARGRGRAFYYQNTLVDVGGIGAPTGNGVYFSAQTQDLATGKLTTSGRIITKYTGAAGKGVLIGTKFYFTRAYAPTDDCMYVYDLTTGLITELANNTYSTAAYGGALCLFQGLLARRDGSKGQVDFYDIGQDKWRTLPPLSTNVPAFSNYAGTSGTPHLFCAYNNALYAMDLNTTTAAKKTVWKLT